MGSPMQRPMTRPVFPAAVVFLLLPAMLAPSAAALAAGDLSVLPKGHYGCWTAGVASGPATSGVPERSFTIARGSSYASPAGGGTYLVASDLLTFTRGPLKDWRLRRNRGGYWQELARDGEPGRLKCSRTGTAPFPRS